MNGSRHHLALVAAPAQPFRQDDSIPAEGPGALLLKPILRERFQARELSAWPDTGARIPFAIRMTAEQVLEVAADADFRAEILDDVADAHVAGGARQVPGRTSIGTGHRRAADLREVAVDLRRIAAALVDG